MVQPRRWKIPVAIAAILIAIPLAMALWVDLSARRRWSAAESRTRELRAEWERRDASRAPLRGSGLEGAAWDDYLQAYQKMSAYLATFPRTLPGDASVSSRLQDYLYNHPKSNKESVQQIVDALRPALLDLRNGVVRKYGRYPIDWSKFGDCPDLLMTMRLTNLALAQARLWRESGRAPEAIRLQLDVVRFCHDISRDGLPIAHTIGQNVAGSALKEIVGTLLQGNLSPTDLESAERELEVLEQTAPRLNGLLQERIDMGSLLERNPEAFDLYSGEWRYGFSSRLKAADILDRVDALSRIQGEWKDVCRSLEALRRDEREPILTQLCASEISRYKEAAAQAARLRVLRTATHWKRTGEKLTLQDPFGGELKVQESETGLKFSSADFSLELPK